MFIWDIRDIRAKFGIPNVPHSPDIRQNSDGGISNYLVFRQSLIKVNCNISRTSDDIDMKLGAVTKLDNRNKTTKKKKKKKIDDDAMPTNCDAIIIFRIYGQFGSIQTHNLWNFHFH